MTNNLLPFSLTAEVTEAKGWNYVLNTPFINDTNYAATVANSKSRGYYTLVEWELSQRILFQYKYDHLTLDENFPEDAYDRHGAGIKTYFGNNFWGILRVEKASAGHPSEENGTKGGAQDAVWAMLSILI